MTTYDDRLDRDANTKTKDALFHVRLTLLFWSNQAPLEKNHNIRIISFTITTTRAVVIIITETEKGFRMFSGVDF